MPKTPKLSHAFQAYSPQIQDDFTSFQALLQSLLRQETTKHVTWLTVAIEYQWNVADEAGYFLRGVVYQDRRVRSLLVAARVCCSSYVTVMTACHSMSNRNIFEIPSLA